MKKIILVLVLLTFAITTASAGCSKDEIKKTVMKAKSIIEGYAAGLTLAGGKDGFGGKNAVKLKAELMKTTICGEGQVFIMTMKGLTFFHARNQFIGKNVSGASSMVNGKKIFWMKDMIAQAKKAGGGYTKYQFSKKGEKGLFDKCAYSTMTSKIGGTKFFIGGGAYYSGNCTN